ncbi:hypothetical protein ACOMHN_028860 [Nucella lapillus]
MEEICRGDFFLEGVHFISAGHLPEPLPASVPFPAVSALLHPAPHSGGPGHHLDCGVLVALPPALGLERGFYHYSPHTHVCSFSHQGISFAQVMVMLFTSAPMAVIGACNFAIFRFWKKARMSLDKWKARDGQGKVLGKRVECVKKSRDMEVSWDPNKDHVVPGSEGEVSVVSVDESRDTVGPKHHDSPTGSLANAVEGPGEEIKHPQIMHSSDDDSMGNKDCNSAASLSSIEANSHHKTAHSERDPNKSNINREHSEAKIITENDPVSARKLPPKHKSEFGAVALDVTRNSLTAPSIPPSASSLSSLGRTQKRTATRNRPHHLVATAAQNRHPQKQQQHAREFAFVRSLFVVFLLTGITFLPYLIIMALSSKVHVPSEIVVLGLLILYVNNSVNWIVYGVMNPSFRKAYSQCGQQLLGMCRQSRAERTDRQHTYSMSSVTAPRQNGAR